MIAALTVVFIFTLSFVIVRIASVAMRLTGLPDHVARFQSISALTGTGFTTGESETIVNYPLRRNILVGLMIFGNLGLVSFMATFVVSFVAVETSLLAIIEQLLLFTAAGILTFVLMTNKSVDGFLCGHIAGLLERFNLTPAVEAHTLVQFEGGHEVVEVIYEGDDETSIPSIIHADGEGKLLALRRIDGSFEVNPSLSSTINRGDTVIFFR